MWSGKERNEKEGIRKASLINYWREGKEEVVERGKCKCVDERKGVAGMARKQETFTPQSHRSALLFLQQLCNHSHAIPMTIITRYGGPMTINTAACVQGEHSRRSQVCRKFAYISKNGRSRWVAHEAVRGESFIIAIILHTVGNVSFHHHACMYIGIWAGGCIAELWHLRHFQLFVLSQRCGQPIRDVRSCAHTPRREWEELFLDWAGYHSSSPTMRPSSSLHALFPEFEVRWRRLLWSLLVYIHWCSN